MMSLLTSHQVLFLWGKWSLWSFPWLRTSSHFSSSSHVRVGFSHQAVPSTLDFVISKTSRAALALVFLMNVKLLEPQPSRVPVRRPCRCMVRVSNFVKPPESSCLNFSMASTKVGLSSHCLGIVQLEQLQVDSSRVNFNSCIPKSGACLTLILLKPHKLIESLRVYELRDLDHMSLTCLYLQNLYILSKPNAAISMGSCPQSDR